MAKNRLLHSYTAQKTTPVDGAGTYGGKRISKGYPHSLCVYYRLENRFLNPHCGVFRGKFRCFYPSVRCMWSVFSPDKPCTSRSNE